MWPDGTRIISILCSTCFPALDVYYADPAQPLTTAGEELDHLDHDLDHDLSDLSVRGMNYLRAAIVTRNYDGSKHR